MHRPPNARRLRGLVTLAILSLASALATTALAAPDATARLAAVCNGCHGADGTGSGAIPALAGREADALNAVLERWRALPDASSSHVMQRFADTLEDSEIRALAEHYANAPPAQGPQRWNDAP